MSDPTNDELPTESPATPTTDETPKAPAGRLWRQLEPAELKSQVLERLLKGHSQRQICRHFQFTRRRLAIVRESIRDNSVANMDRRLMERHLNEMWMKLDLQEKLVWEKLDDSPSKSELSRLLDNLDRVNGRRMQILETLDPGPDQSIDVDSTLVVIHNREELRAVMDAKELLKVVDEQISNATRKRSQKALATTSVVDDPPETTAVSGLE